MKKCIHILTALMGLAFIVEAQEIEMPSLDIGDSAPGIHVTKWLKGHRVEGYQKDHLYVIEFWATWCKPCIAAMPHLSMLANTYSNELSIIGVNVDEKKGATIGQVQAFVDSLGDRMDYAAAIDTSQTMISQWMLAANERGIPKTFVVNGEGKVAWIGHPKDLQAVLERMLLDSWHLDEARANRDEERYIDSLAIHLNFLLYDYRKYSYETDDFHYQVDSMLTFLEKMVTKEPRLDNHPIIVVNRFNALFQRDQAEAFLYLERIWRSNTKYALQDDIVNLVRAKSKNHTLLTDFYTLGLEAYQDKVADSYWSDNANIPRFYEEMAVWSQLSGEMEQSVFFQEKAIELVENNPHFAKGYDLVAMRSKRDAYAGGQ